MPRSTLGLFFLLVVLRLSAQGNASEDERESDMSPHLWRHIFDPSVSGCFKVDTVGLGALPPEAEYRGVLVEAVKWSDTIGTHAVFLTQTGDFRARDNAGDEYDRAELHAYHWLVTPGTQDWCRAWKLDDHNMCPELDQYVGFSRGSLSITDLDVDGEAEITVAYRLSCRGGTDPGELKIIMYEGKQKYGIRGAEALCHPETGKILEPSRPVADVPARSVPAFLAFLKARWEKFQCIEYKQFY